MNIYPTKAEFKRLAKKGNVVPVYGEVFDDLETPVSAFLKIDDGRYSYLLESLEGAEKVARYSFLGSSPRLIFKSTRQKIEIIDLRKGKRSHTQFTCDNPLAEVQKLINDFKFVSCDDLPRFCGGLVGYVGYDTIQFIESIPQHAKDDLETPDILLMLADSMVVFDRVRNRIVLLANAILEGQSLDAAYGEAVSRIQTMAGKLHGPLPKPKKTSSKPRGQAPSVKSTVTKAEFAAMVKKAKAYIRAGDIFQVVLSQRLERDIRCQPFDVYRAMRFLNPSPYSFFIRFGELALAGASPEMLVRCEEGMLETRPIAGTRPRGKTEKDDQRLIQQLLASPKERAEHIMLVDLGRNDLGRVAKTGSVKIPELMVIEKYSHVMHIVSSVTAEIKKGCNAFDVLRAAFPAGTVSGAPKIRAMEIIAELEKTRRGHYAGAVAYFGFNGNLDSCIAIRTLFFKGQKASVQAGAGIVADSQPEREYEETLNKAKGMLLSLDVAEERFT